MRPRTCPCLPARSGRPGRAQPSLVWPGTGAQKPAPPEAAVEAPRRPAGSPGPRGGERRAGGREPRARAGLGWARLRFLSRGPGSASAARPGGRFTWRPQPGGGPGPGGWCVWGGEVALGTAPPAARRASERASEFISLVINSKLLRCRECCPFN